MRANRRLRSVVTVSSQAEESAGKMSYPTSVTLLLILAVLARGKFSTTTAPGSIIIINVIIIIIITTVRSYYLHLALVTRLDARNVRASPPPGCVRFLPLGDRPSLRKRNAFFFPVEARQVATPPSAREAFTAEATIC